MTDQATNAEAQRLQARSATHPMFSTAYVEIERRAEALQRMRTSPDAQRENEPSGVRWARDDIRAMQHIGKDEASLAVHAISRSMEASRSYAATITEEAPILINMIVHTKAERAFAARDAGEAMALETIRERSRDAASNGVAIGRVDGQLKVTQPGRGIEGMTAEAARQMARDDLQDLRTIKRHDRLEAASAVIAENMRNPAYKVEFAEAAKHQLARAREADSAAARNRAASAPPAPQMRRELDR